MSKVVVRKRYSSWQYTIELARVNGKRKRASKSGFRTKAEALAAGTAALADYNRTGISFVPAGVGRASVGVDIYTSMAYILHKYSLLSLATLPIVI